MVRAFYVNMVWESTTNNNLTFPQAYEYKRLSPANASTGREDCRSRHSYNSNIQREREGRKNGKAFRVDGVIDFCWECWSARLPHVLNAQATPVHTIPSFEEAPGGGASSSSSSLFLFPSLSWSLRSHCSRMTYHSFVCHGVALVGVPACVGWNGPEQR